MVRPLPHLGLRCFAFVLSAFVVFATAAQQTPTALDAAVDELWAQPGLRGLLILHEGEVAAERFRGGLDADEPVNVKSASKSLLSALVGIAIEHGELEGVHQTLGELLPGRVSGKKAEITLEDLLTMTSGLETVSGENYGAWVASDDWVEAALEQPLVDRPGSTFTYSTGNSHLVSAILTRATGMSTRAYAKKHLLDPLEISIASWEEDPQGIPLGGNQVAMSARDLARFGELYLQEGRWNGKQIVPAAWVERSTRVHAEGWPDRYGEYGYLWWVRPDAGAFMAVGYGGQYLYVAPEDDLVIVLISTIDSKGAEWDRRVISIVEEEVRGGPSPTHPGGAFTPLSTIDRSWRPKLFRIGERRETSNRDAV